MNTKSDLPLRTVKYELSDMIQPNILNILNTSNILKILNTSLFQWFHSTRVSEWTEIIITFKGTCQTYSCPFKIIGPFNWTAKREPNLSCTVNSDIDVATTNAACIENNMSRATRFDSVWNFNQLWEWSLKTTWIQEPIFVLIKYFWWETKSQRKLFPCFSFTDSYVYNQGSKNINHNCSLCSCS